MRPMNSSWLCSQTSWEWQENQSHHTGTKKQSWSHPQGIFGRIPESKLTENNLHSDFKRCLVWSNLRKRIWPHWLPLCSKSCYCSVKTDPSFDAREHARAGPLERIITCLCLAHLHFCALVMLPDHRQNTCIVMKMQTPCNCEHLRSFISN